MLYGLVARLHQFFALERNPRNLVRQHDRDVHNIAQQWCAARMPNNLQSVQGSKLSSLVPVFVRTLARQHVQVEHSTPLWICLLHKQGILL